MRLRLLFALLLLLLAASLPAQVNLTISGHVLNSSTGLAAGYQSLTVQLLDTSNFNVIYAQIGVTDSLGDYNMQVSAPNVPTTGTGKVEIIECNGAIQTLSFAFSPGNTVLSNLNFTICPIIPQCNVYFTAQTQVGNDSVWLEDYSTTNTGFVTSWVWTMGNGDTIVGFPSEIYGYASPGTYNICLTINTNMGCTATGCYTVTTGTGPGTCSAALVYDTLFSGALGFTLTPSSSSAYVASITYDFGDGQLMTVPDTSYAYTYLNGGTYLACAYVLFSDGCTANTCTNVTSSGSSCLASYTAVPDTTGQYSLYLIDNSIGNNLSYLWSFGDGDTSTLQYPQHTYAGPGGYTVCLTVTDNPFTCSSTFCDSIVVVNKLNTPFTIQVVPALPTGRPDMATLEGMSTVSPNPADHALQVTMELPRACLPTFEIYNLQGKLMDQKTLGKQPAGTFHHVLDLSQLPQGVYLLHVQAGESTSTHRILVSR